MERAENTPNKGESFLHLSISIYASEFANPDVNSHKDCTHITPFGKRVSLYPKSGR